MTRHATLTPILLLLAAPAAADITADDVWANTTTYYAATGGDLTANLTRDGSSVYVEAASLTYVFPFDLGQVVIDLPPMTMVEEVDGTVTQKLPKTFKLNTTLERSFLIDADITLRNTITQEGFTATASGSPGDITYQREASGFAAAMDLDMKMGLEETIYLSFNIAGDAYSQKTRITEGDLITIALESTTDAMRYEYQSDEGYGYRTEGRGVYEAGVGRAAIALPAGGTDITNLAPALAAGLSIDAASTSSGSEDATSTYVDNQLVSSDSTKTGPAQSTIQLSADGFSGFADVTDVEVGFEMSDIFDLDMQVAMGLISARYRFPLMAAETAQPMEFAMTFDDVTVNDGTWDLLDADRAIPRDPMRFNIDLAGDLLLGVDLVNFAQLEEAFAGADLPIGIETLTLKALNLVMAGVTAEGAGAFTFDNDDLQTFDGFPRPEGIGEINVTGANQLLDTLVDAGIVPQAEIGMGRMMLGMFTRPTGDDALSSKLEIMPDGEVRVNGERVR